MSKLKVIAKSRGKVLAVCSDVLADPASEETIEFIGEVINNESLSVATAHVVTPAGDYKQEQIAFGDDVQKSERLPRVKKFLNDKYGKETNVLKLTDTNEIAFIQDKHFN